MTKWKVCILIGAPSVFFNGQGENPVYNDPMCSFFLYIITQIKEFFFTYMGDKSKKIYTFVI